MATRLPRILVLDPSPERAAKLVGGLDSGRFAAMSMQDGDAALETLAELEFEAALVHASPRAWDWLLRARNVDPDVQMVILGASDDSLRQVATGIASGQLHSILPWPTTPAEIEAEVESAVAHYAQRVTTDRRLHLETHREHRLNRDLDFVEASPMPRSRLVLDDRGTATLADLCRHVAGDNVDLETVSLVVERRLEPRLATRVLDRMRLQAR